MQEFTDLHLREQEKVNTYFHRHSSYWTDIYASGDVQARIIRERHVAVLDWVDGLALAPDSRVLEVGCGAGFMAIALTQRDFRVCAVDSVKGMVELARRHAAEQGAIESLTLDVGDIYALAFEDSSFELVIAIGVIPWLERPERAIQEMARVVKPGGYIILTTANCAGLASLLDPLMNPLLAPLKRRVKELLDRAGLHRQSPGMTYHSCRYIDKLLVRSGMVKSRGMTCGFGFSFFRRRVLPGHLEIALHHRLQHLADRRVPVFRSCGMAYLVLARKLASRSSVRSTDTERTFSERASL